MLATALSVSMICSNANIIQAQENTQTNETIAENGDVIIPNDETGIPDANLYNAILNGMISNESGNGYRSEVDSNKDGLLSVAEAERVSHVYASTATKNLQGIQYCKNLESFSSGSYGEKGKISDISPLAGMDNLTSLYLSGNQITDISVLAELVNLEVLSLSENQISDITVLADLKNLTSLELAGNQVKDTSALAGKNLWQLNLSYNPLDENAIDIISNIVSVTELYLAGTQLTNEDIEKLANLERLSGFDFSDNQISDISPLDNIWEYVYLIDLSNNQLSDVSVLTGLGGTAARFYLSNNQISDVTPFADSNIHTLDLSNNQISDFTAALGREYLNLSNNQISDITPLLTNSSGVVIDLSNNQIADISVLKDLKEGLFWSINLSNNKITDITPITNNDFIIEGIGVLNLSNNQISDITSFAKVSHDANLCELDLSNNNIRDISTLDTLKENGCNIITDGNPIGEPEEDKPNEDEKPSEPTTPENPDDAQKPSEPTTPENPDNEQKPSEPTTPENPDNEQKPSEPTTPDKPNKPIYNSDNFAELLEKQDIVVKPNEYVTITFEKGSKLNDTNGKNEFDFTTTITTDYTNAKLPTFITKNSFITKVSYTYSGVLPSKASIEIFVGKDYVGKEVFYFLLNDDNTFDKNEVQKVKVNENGYIKVTQEHCSDYVVTTENPETLFEATQKPESKPQEPQQPKDETTNNPENNGTTNDNTTNDNNNKEESPKTGSHTSFDVWCIAILSGIMLIVLYKRKQA